MKEEPSSLFIQGRKKIRGGGISEWDRQEEGLHKMYPWSMDENEKGWEWERMDRAGRGWNDDLVRKEVTELLNNDFNFFILLTDFIFEFFLAFDSFSHR